LNPRHFCAAQLSAVLLLASCTITQSVDPVAVRPAEVCVARNDTVHMTGFHDELVRQIEARGIAVRSFDGAVSEDCRHRVSYTANWRWDMAMYLAYAQVNVTEDGRPVGSAVYDATQGGANMGKFGPTAEKLAPLVGQLFG
jgi:hypothetical protein